MRKTTKRGRLKLLDAPGTFQCVFATLGVIDHDGDVIAAGAFKRGQEVRITAWGHDWGSLPVGKGAIQEMGDEALCDGEFFLDTEGGKETYRVVRRLGSLQEWSFGFDILDSVPSKLDGQSVRLLRALDVHEISPVLKGAGIATRTVALKGLATGMTPAGARRQILALSDPGSLKAAIAQELGDLADSERRRLRRRLKEGAGASAPTRLDVIRDQIRQANPGSSAAWVAAMVDGQLQGVAARIYGHMQLQGSFVPNYAEAIARAEYWVLQPAYPAA